ncbi:MAG: Omp28-related outer membrane protein, partial [Muribaculaceae bacterium]|nr:Omp28-related outer membrane protein [Muribaculaceae bacterium]
MIFKRLFPALVSATAALSPFTVNAADTLVDWAMYQTPFSSVQAASLYTFGDVTLDDEVRVDNLKNFAAIRISSDVATDYAGCEIKSIKPISGIFEDDPSTQTIKVSLAYSLDGDPIFTKEYHPVGSVMDINTYQVDWKKDIIEIDTETPILFEAGKEMYVILEYTETSDRNYEYVIDWDPYAEYIPEGSYYSAFEGTAYLNGVKKTFTKQWTDVSQDIMCGPLCVALAISGAEGGVENSVEITSLDLPERVIPGEAFSISAKLHNLGANGVNSVKAVCKMNDEAIEQTIELDELVYDYTTDITFKDLSWNDDCILHVNMTVTEVNGETNGASLNAASKEGSLKCITDGYIPNVVIEEGTGTWCGWCTRGIVAMDMMRDLYQDGSFIGMAVHNGDEMEALYAKPVFNLISDWVGGYPAMIVNRTGGYDPAPASMNYQYEKMRSTVTYGKIDIDGFIDGDEVVVTSKSTLSINDPKSDIRVGYAVLEDNVGPYIQQNYYSGGSHGEMGGFENEPKMVSLIFNDVVRSYYGCEGLPGSIPTEIKKGEEYVHECRIPLTNVTNKDEVSVVAMLIDATTGEIINGAKQKHPTSAVSAIQTEDRGRINIEGSTLTLLESDMDAELFSVAGKKVATLKPNVALSVESG